MYTATEISPFLARFLLGFEWLLAFGGLFLVPVNHWVESVDSLFPLGGAFDTYDIDSAIVKDVHRRFGLFHPRQLEKQLIL